LNKLIIIKKRNNKQKRKQQPFIRHSPEAKVPRPTAKATLADGQGTMSREGCLEKETHRKKGKKCVIMKVRK